MLAFFPRQNRLVSMRVPKQAKCDPSRCMTIPLLVITLASVILGLGANTLVRLITNIIVV